MAHATIAVTIEGKTILMHKFPEATKAGLTAPGGRIRKPIPSPTEEAEEAAYRDADGKLAQPAMHILICLGDAGARLARKGKGSTTYKKAILEEVRITPEMIPHVNHDGGDYEIDARPVTIQRSKIVRHRPLLRDWQLDFEVEIHDTRELPVAVVQQALEIAGRMGIGDYRPIFGQFEVVSFEVQ